jgi:TonB family protein
MQLKLHEPITMQFRNSSLTDVLTFIGRQSGIKFAYDADFANTTVTISVPRTSVLVALEQLLGSVGYTYEVAGPDMLLITRPRNQSTSADRRGGGQQMPPRDFKPGEPGPPLNREVELQKALAADPGSPSTLYLELAKLQERRGAIADAESTLLAARQAQPTDTRVLTTLAGFYTRTNRFDRAIAVVEDAAAADPSNPGLHQMVATYYWEKAFKDQSLTPTEKATYIQAGIAATDRALTYEPDHVESLTYKNILLRMQANMETDRARQAELIALADTLRNRAMELNKARRLSGGGTDVRAPGAPPPPPPPPPPGQDPIVIDGQTAVRIGGSIGPPRKLKDVRPVYPDEAQKSRVQGVVIVEAVVDALGSVRETKVLRSIPMLDQAAVDAVQQWEFQPTLLNGVPVPVVMTVTVNFTLQ